MGYDWGLWCNLVRRPVTKGTESFSFDVRISTDIAVSFTGLRSVAQLGATAGNLALLEIKLHLVQHGCTRRFRFVGWRSAARLGAAAGTSAYCSIALWFAADRFSKPDARMDLDS